MNIGRSSTVRLLLLALPLFGAAALTAYHWPQPRAAIYQIYRDRAMDRALSRLQEYDQRIGEHFVIYFTESDQDVADLILETAEAVYQPVVKRVGFRPSARVPIIVYPDREELRSAFGWGKSESATGVYFAGTIRLLSPNAWIHVPNEPTMKRVFHRLNPIAHELTHFLLDYLTNGNYPRWFTEGLAQRVEYQITGYLWLEPHSTLRQELYTLEDLQRRFDQLPNQPLVYRQSYLLVDYLASNYGEERLAEVIQHLGRGVTFSAAVHRTFGSPLEQLYGEWETWLYQNLHHLDPVK